MTVTNEHIFKSAFNPAFPRQISKYYNHYEIGEFPVASSLYVQYTVNTEKIIKEENSMTFSW